MLKKNISIPQVQFLISFLPLELKSDHHDSIKPAGTRHTNITSPNNNGDKNIISYMRVESN